MNIIIFANGVPPHTDSLIDKVKQADLVIAADGGAAHCSKYGMLANILVGDLDSIKPALLAKYQQQQKEIHKHPTHKDATDLELCMDLALEKGAKNLDIIAALGGRWDMSFGNILLATAPRFQSVKIQFFEQGCTLQILHPPGPHEIAGQIGTTVSFLPLGGAANGVHLEGVAYPLQNHRIEFGSSLGLSNVFSKSKISVQLKTGILLAIVADNS